MSNQNNEIPNGFKKTEIGIIPEDWEVVKLEELNIKNKKTINPAKYPDELFEYYSIPAYQENKKPIIEKGCNIRSQKILLKNGTVLFGKLNPRVEKVWLVSSKNNLRKIGSTEWLPIYPNIKKVNPQFLYYIEWSKYVIQVAKTLVSGSTPSRQRVDPQSFYEIKIPLPPLTEQKKIAHVLSTIQEAKEKTEAVIKAAKELKKSLMKYLFTYGPVPFNEAENVKIKETEIGLIPEDWEVVKLGDITKEKDGIKRGPWGGSIKKEIFVPHGYKVYEQKNVISNDFAIGNYFIDENKFYELIDFEVKSGDILLTAAGTIGKIAIVPSNIQRGIINQALIRIRLKDNLIYRVYFKYLFDYLVGEKVLESMSHGATMKNLASVRVLKNLLIPLPPLPIQQKIASILSAVDEKIEKEENKKKALEELFKSMLHNLMTGKIRVKDLEVENERL